jgi:hypothetical protein
VNGFFKLITPFIDPLTRQKLKFNDDMRQHVPPQQLWNEFHGDMKFEYEHAVYWPALLKLSKERYSEHYERWVKAGKHYGESEIYLRGGNAPGVYQSSENEIVPAPQEATVSAENKDTAAEGDISAPVDDAPAAELSNAPIRTNCTQSNGNTDILTGTFEGDRA